MNITQKSLALGLVGAVTLGGTFAPAVTGTANAAPLSSTPLAVKEALASDVINVRRWRGYGYGGGAVFAGVALGVLGAAIASRSYYRPYYGGYGPYYGGYGPYYSGAYYYPTGYYGYRPYRYRPYRPYRHYGYRYRPWRYYW